MRDWLITGHNAANATADKLRDYALSDECAADQKSAVLLQAMGWAIFRDQLMVLAGPASPTPSPSNEPSPRPPVRS